MEILLYAIWGHCLADFFLQTDYQAKNKSENPLVLVFHCSIYGLVMGLVMRNTVFGYFCFLSHLFIDCVSSQFTSYFWKKEMRSSFFNTIGVDQAIHMTVIVFLLNELNML